ncbi:thermonuclease family protein [Pararhizobium antarcticum]|uniref:Nuclease n=1 Tax=Pararhizobium antarcticum TaxID=1798805 RepID=A0A657LLK4_9HYPH|nr:thermonuclease family protein [Pararhizobium antarcticum]OJF91352.1 nuclease [Pararhizobium antarcticum]OJG01329.1 nuclease [Rhizobium sp. 58]
MESLSRPLLFALLLPLLTAGTIRPAIAFDRGAMIDGPVRASIIKIIDGDTLLVAAKPWPQQTMEVYVRLRGIDAPETKSDCASTRAAGEQAKAALVAMLGGQSEIKLLHIAGDKYFGRVLADIALIDGRNPAQELLSAGYVSEYKGGKKRTAVCSFW